MDRFREDAFERATEIWFQTNFDSTLWEAETGLIVNTAALNERETFFKVSRIPSATSLGTDRGLEASV